MLMFIVGLSIGVLTAISVALPEKAANKVLMFVWLEVIFFGILHIFGIISSN